MAATRNEDDPETGDRHHHMKGSKRSPDISFEAPPLKRSRCSESVSSYITSWLDQIPHTPTLDLPEMGLLDSSSSSSSSSTKKSDKSKVTSDGKHGNGFKVPTTPASVISAASGYSRPGTATDSSKRSERLVSRPEYRSQNLKNNRIYSRPMFEELDSSLQTTLKKVHAKRISPEPDKETLKKEMRRLELIQHDGAPESRVEGFFKAKVFPDEDAMVEQGMMVVAQARFLPQNVPGGQSVPHKVSSPVPDLAYGYGSIRGPFSEPQQLVGQKMDPPLGQPATATHQLSFPFFCIEFKGQGYVNGDMLVATNQCLGGSATCLEMVDRLNRLLKATPEAKTIDNISFSIAMDQNTANLYISWKPDELSFYMQRTNIYALGKPDDYLEFRRHVKNIIDWGKNERLKSIQNALDSILEADRKIVERQSKQREPPTSQSGSHNAKQPRYTPSNSTGSVGSEQSYRGTANLRNPPLNATGSANRPTHMMNSSSHHVSGAGSGKASSHVGSSSGKSYQSHADRAHDAYRARKENESPVRRRTDSPPRDQRGGKERDDRRDRPTPAEIAVPAPPQKGQSSFRRKMGRP